MVSGSEVLILITTENGQLLKTNRVSRSVVTSIAAVSGTLGFISWSIRTGLFSEPEPLTAHHQHNFFTIITI
jgi:hypothetical protein